MQVHWDSKSDAKETVFFTTSVLLLFLSQIGSISTEINVFREIFWELRGYWNMKDEDMNECLKLIRHIKLFVYVYIPRWWLVVISGHNFLTV